MKKINFNFLRRHLGPNDTDIDLMLESMSLNTVDDLIKKVIPPNIFSRIGKDLIDIILSEDEVLLKLKDYANKNILYKSFIGMGYYGTIVPNVIKEIFLRILDGILNILHIKLKLAKAV